MKKGLYLFLVLILMFTVSAADFSIKATPIQPYALTTGIAEYNITVKNLKGVQDHIDFKPMEDLRFTPQSVPTYIIPSGITIDGYETKNRKSI